MNIQPINWTGDSIRILDQSKLPSEEVFLDLQTSEDVDLAIREMKVRGAPAIGVTAAYGMALAAKKLKGFTNTQSLKALDNVAEILVLSRPTAVNLKWSLDRIMNVAKHLDSSLNLYESILSEAHKIHKETQISDTVIAEAGASLINRRSSVLTHCNTGALATGGFGTALGVIRHAWSQGKIANVIATETRPWLQGARLTVWELTKWGIPVTLIVDSAAGYLMSIGSIQYVIVGADRIAANGDFANKIGTCSLAIMANVYDIPFYVAAPTNTIDRSTGTGAEIQIEERPPRELAWESNMWPEEYNSKALNLSFDVTPYKYVQSIITEKGIAKPPYKKSIEGLFKDGK